ncbi:hypothetical protein RHMOL_Rhmol07G0140500 [Rhododendron molle]|uniref:Uncharacterized protein n=1 Tax=Rhododendron molle TaxID=49168 RepID=A0ACC0N2B4_RHOML|nr:hypothetical protein RHMOL_Rhmol07G0140500 [Rhododendron molle]
MSMALFSSPPTHLPPSLSPKTHLTQKTFLSLKPTKSHFLVSIRAAENGSGGTVASVAATVEGKKVSVAPEAADGSLGPNGSPAAAAAKEVAEFGDARWVGGTWDLNQFQKDGKTDWDAVIDAEVRRRKWLENDPESTSNENPVFFDTSIIPWWAWVKRFHLPEAERLNGRAAMIGFFMAYLVDSLTGVGLVDQMGNFFCKTLLFVSVVGVLLIRKNEDIDTLKKLIKETTFYDKQWQATWQDETSSKD